MNVTITYDDTLYQLVPKMLQLNLKDFLAIANKHPDIVGAPVYYAVYPAPDESLSAAPTPPAQPAGDDVSKIEAKYWLKSRAAIIDAIESAGFTLMSTRGKFWLQKKP